MSRLTIPPVISPTRKPLKYPFHLPSQLDPSCVLCLLPIRDNKWYDFSHKGNHGAITNAVWTAKGRHGPALYFDGDGDYVNAGKDASLNITKAITLEQWLYPLDSGQSGYGGLWSRGADFDFYMAGATVEDIASYIPIGGVNYHPYTIGGRLSYNKWHHLVLTYNGSILILYADRLVAFSEAASGALDIYPDDDLIIGNDYTKSYSFHGYFDVARIYNRALSAAEVKALYEQGLTRG